MRTTSSYRGWLSTYGAWLVLLSATTGWASTSTTEAEPSFLKKHFGMNYNSFFAGPGISGNLGDTKPVGDGVSELRVDVGGSYRVYYGKHGQALVILLCGGDKGSQQSDIALAKTYWTDWKRRNS